MAKQKKLVVDLDALITKDKVSVVSAEEVTKIRDAKFAGGTKKLPSLTARGIYDALMAKPNEGRGINVEAFTTEQKDAVVRQVKKDLARCLKAAKKTDLRVRGVDQGNVVKFFFDRKKQKEEKKTGTGGKR